MFSVTTRTAYTTQHFPHAHSAVDLWLLSVLTDLRHELGGPYHVSYANDGRQIPGKGIEIHMVGGLRETLPRALCKQLWLSLKLQTDEGYRGELSRSEEARATLKRNGLMVQPEPDRLESWAWKAGGLTYLTWNSCFRCKRLSRVKTGPRGEERG